MGKGSCTQNNKKSRNAPEKGNPKNREKQIQ